MPRNRKKNRGKAQANAKRAGDAKAAEEAALVAAQARDPTHPEYMKVGALSFSPRLVGHDVDEPVEVYVGAMVQAQGNKAFAARDYITAIDWFSKVRVMMGPGAVS